MTFAELQTLASDWLDDPQNGYFTLPILKQRLNLSLRELQKRLISANEEYYATCVTTNTVTGQAAYALPADFMQVLRFEWKPLNAGATYKPQKINEMTPNQRDLLSDMQGDPGFYYMQKNNLILAPFPSRIVELHLEYSYYVQDMVNDDDVPDAPQQFHEYIAILTTRDCMIKDGRSIVSIKDKLNEYETLLKQIAVQRQADEARMVVQTNSMDYYG